MAPMRFFFPEHNTWRPYREPETAYRLSHVLDGVYYWYPREGVNVDYTREGVDLHDDVENVPDGVSND